MEVYIYKNDNKEYLGRTPDVPIPSMGDTVYSDTEQGGIVSKVEYHYDLGRIYIRMAR